MSNVRVIYWLLLCWVSLQHSYSNLLPQSCCPPCHSHPSFQCSPTSNLTTSHWGRNQSVDRRVSFISRLCDCFLCDTVHCVLLSSKPNWCCSKYNHIITQASYRPPPRLNHHHHHQQQQLTSLCRPVCGNCLSVHHFQTGQIDQSRDASLSLVAEYWRCAFHKQTEHQVSGVNLRDVMSHYVCWLCVIDMKLTLCLSQCSIRVLIFILMISSMCADYEQYIHLPMIISMVWHWPGNCCEFTDS
jgi:hypothetical protein